MKKLIVTIVTVLFMSVVAIPLGVSAEEVGKTTVYEDESIKVLQDGNVIILEDKESTETIKIDVDDNGNGTLTSENGETEKVTRDSDGNIYLDNRLEMS